MESEEIKKFIAGGIWTSIAPDIRPSSIKNADGSLKAILFNKRF